MRILQGDSLREGVKYKPIHSRYKVIIIDEVHMLTREAFNALLKTLEEPPPHTVFIFATTEFHKVPATIMSRCQHFEFKKISQKEIINHLVDITQKEKIKISSSGLNLIAEAADGSLRDAQSLLDKAVAFSGEVIGDEDLKEILGTISKDLLFAFSKTILEEKPDEVFPLVEKVIENGYDLRFLYKELVQHFRNLLLVKSAKNPQDLLALNEGDMNDLKDEAKKASEEELLRYLVVLQQGEPGLKFSSHPRIYLEVFLVKLSHFKKITPLKDVIQELEDIKKELKSPSGKEFSKNTFQQEKVMEEKVPEASNQKINETIPSKIEEDKGKREREIETAMKDPSVQSFMDKFKAQVLSVKPIKKPEADKNKLPFDLGRKK
jgi:DNA polymerase-3 subunit gamma/tau